MICFHGEGDYVPLIEEDTPYEEENNKSEDLFETPEAGYRSA
jgi:hypothetical protein